MDTKKVIFLTLGAVGILGFSYVVYFDYMRRNDPDFRRRLKRDRKKAARAKRAKEEDARNRLTNFARQALDEVNKEDFPESVEGKEKYFMDQVSKGETLFAGGEAGYQAAAICFYKALKVYPSPLELIMIYQKTIPEAVFNLVYTMMSMEVKKKQEEYWEVFPPKSMNVKIQRVDEINQSSSDDKDKTIRRGVFATKDFKEGDVVYSETPIVSALDPRLENDGFCSYCLREISETPVDDDQDLFSAVYCSEACKTHARDEYAGILFLKANSSGSTNKESRLVDLITNGNVKYPLMIARFLARMVYEETQKVATGVDEEYSTFDHVERLRYLDVQATPKDLKEIELLRELLASKVPGIEEFISEERYMILKGRLLYNAYGINTAQSDTHIKENLDETIRSSNTSSMTGAGFYCVTSHLAHSCAPNTEVTFKSHNHELTLVATKPIQAGEELNVSYIRLGNRDTSDRKTELFKNWRFNCSCKKCLADDLQESTDDDERNWVDDDEQNRSIKLL